MDCESECNDNYDYLSVLGNSKRLSDNSKRVNHSNVVSVSADSDTDSDDCMIIEDKPQNDSIIKDKVMNESPKAKPKLKVESKVTNTPKSPHLKSERLDLKFESITKGLNAIKNTIKSESKPKPKMELKTESIDQKINIIPDIKPFDTKSEICFKSETNVKMDPKISIKNSKNNCDFRSDNSSTKRLKLSEERIGETDDSNDLANNSFNSISVPKGLESLVNDDYCPIDEIDVSSAHVFTHSFKEVEPRVVNLNLDQANDSNSPTSMTSMSFSSTTQLSPNHKKNKEERRRTPCPSTTSEDIDGKLSRIDYQNWLCEEVPRYSPFLAQRGDRVVYLRDAHQIYIEHELEVLKQLYPKWQSSYQQICDSIKSSDYIIFATITDVKFCQINYIKFSIIRLKSQSKDVLFEFNLLYRPNLGICEFLVLEKFYKSCQSIEWTPGSHFQSLWKKCWWIGVIENKSVFDPNYPNSLFKCYEVKWNSGEEGRLSPWDLFEVHPNRVPKNKKNGIVVTREDLLGINYKPNENEWPEVVGLDSKLWRCYESKRIYNGLKLIEKHVSKPIVDIVRDCRHREIAYSVNLQVIKSRLKNMFYRRKDKHFKYVEDFVDLIVCIANDTECSHENQYLDYIHKYKHLTHSTPNLLPQTNGTSAPTHVYTSEAAIPHKPNRHISKASKSSKSIIESKSVAPIKKKSNPLPSQPEVKVTESQKWKQDSQRFIEDLLKKPESEPYRQPVDSVLFPTYHKVIENPIDLSEIERKLANDCYVNPIELRKDFRLMYENAKVFTKNPKSAMRIINKNLSNLSEDRLREIIVDWDRVYHYEHKQRTQKGVKVREPISRSELWGYGAQQYY